MADTRSHSHDPAAGLPVQSDDVSFQGIVWFAVILTITTVFCAAVVGGIFSYLTSRADASDPARSPVARPAGELPPGPTLLTDEPTNLRTFRASEESLLHSYGWVDRNAGTVRIPIERAKDLLVERGLPVR